MNRFLPWLGYLPFLDADAGGGSGGDAGHSEGSNSGNDAGGDEGKPGQSQADIDKIVTQRLARAKKQWEADAKAERDKAAMSEAERLKAEKAEIEKASEARVSAANQRLIRAEATAQATALGIKPDRIKHALKLADLSAVDVDDEGEPDSKAIKKALEAVISELPELKGGESGASRSGGQFNGNTGKLTPEQFDKMTYEERVSLYQRDPGRYNELSQTRR